MQHLGHLVQELQITIDLHRKHCSHILISDVVLQQPDLCLSFVAALKQYVHDLQQLSLHLLLTDKHLLSLQTLVRSTDTDTSLQSLGWFSGLACPARLIKIYTVVSCPGPATCTLEHLHSNCHLYDG